MQVASSVKSTVYSTAYYSGLSRAFALRYRGRGVIFVLHSVTENGTLQLDETLRCPVGTLEWTLQRLRRQGVELVSLDAAVERLEAPSSGRFAAFTFDDGFADNLTRALPVMETFAAPFTVYVTTGMITRDLDAWWFGLAALIRARDRIELPAFGGHFDCADWAGKRRVYARITAAVHGNFDLLQPLQEAIKSSGIVIRDLVHREALTTTQLQSLARHPLVTIGGHTTTHGNLARAAAATVRSEMADNRKFLSDVTGMRIEHVAYPFGHPDACGAREAEIARSLGFRTGVTTRPGTVFAEHRHHLHALPRACIGYDETASTLDCKITGFNRAMHSRLGNPIARM